MNVLEKMRRRRRVSRDFRAELVLNVEDSAEKFTDEKRESEGRKWELWEERELGGTISNEPMRSA